MDLAFSYLEKFNVCTEELRNGLCKMPFNALHGPLSFDSMPETADSMRIRRQTT